MMRKRAGLSSLSLRPVYHPKDERIRSHVLICWLALLLVRIAEVETGLVGLGDAPHYII